MGDLTKQLIALPSNQLLHRLDEVRHELMDNQDALVEAIANFETIKTYLPSLLAEIVVNFMDRNFKRNDAKDRALASEKYREHLDGYNAAFAEKIRLEKKCELANNTIKALTSIAFLKNAEMKKGL